ncbi:MAG: phenylalanine--tRNA ligase subunit alpha [Verrucomicrobiales bacterium]
MEAELDALEQSALTAIAAAADDGALNQCRVELLGKKSRLTEFGSRMRDVAPEQKKAVGARLNEVRQAITQAIEAKQAALTAQEDAAAVGGIDVTLPGRPQWRGALHPLTQIQDRAVQVLRRMGFALAEGPEVETEWHCFDALNTPPDHPARNEQDTFYFPNGWLLRTHTSTVQIRTMESQPPPVRIIAPGSAYRRDEIDATHLSAFNQIEGLFVAEGVALADLKGMLESFYRALCGSKTRLRFRPHFFPFTEPSYEVDLELHVAGQTPRWVEIAGCGMVDPAVFTAVCQKRGDADYDPGKVTGFAFGMGLERLAMVLWGVPDIRYFIENDVRFLRQFA